MPEVRPELPEDDEMRPEGRVNSREIAFEASNRRVSPASGLMVSLPLPMPFDQPICSACP
jgi:hypothetical protein